MPQIKLTKNELKNQKDSLKIYQRYLPTLVLKKQQLQVEIHAIEIRHAEVQAREEALKKEFESWLAVLGEYDQLDAVLSAAGTANLLTIKELRTSEGNIAGVSIPVFEKVEFTIADYDLLVTPLWLDGALQKIQETIALNLEARILEVQVERLNAELRTTSQRVNLFEKVKIPEAKRNIKKIRVYLGDQQTAQVVRGKLAKQKIIKEGL